MRCRCRAFGNIDERWERVLHVGAARRDYEFSEDNPGDVRFECRDFALVRRDGIWFFQTLAGNMTRIAEHNIEKLVRACREPL